MMMMMTLVRAARHITANLPVTCHSNTIRISTDTGSFIWLEFSISK